MRERESVGWNGGREKVVGRREERKSEEEGGNEEKKKKWWKQETTKCARALGRWGGRRRTPKN